MNSIVQRFAPTKIEGIISLPWSTIAKYFVNAIFALSSNKNYGFPSKTSVSYMLPLPDRCTKTERHGTLQGFALKELSMLC